MGWFDEQIKNRRQADDSALEDSFARIAGSVMGERLSAAVYNNSERTKNAIDQVLRYYHVKPGELPDGINGMEEILEYQLRPVGIMTRMVHLDPGWHRDAAGAMLTMMADSEDVVALIPTGIGGYYYRDPATGRRIRVTTGVEKRLSDEACAFYKPFPMKALGVAGLLRFIVENLEAADLVRYVLVMLIVTLVGMLLPAINARLFSVVAGSGSVSILAAMACFLFCTSVSSVLFGVVRDLSMNRMNKRLQQSVEAAVMMRVLSLPASFFKNYRAGELSDRMQYIGTLVNQLLGLLLSSGLSSVFSLLYVTQIMHYAPTLVAPALVITVLTFVVSVTTALLQKRVSARQMELSARERGLAYALVSGVQKISLAGAEKRAFAKWAGLYAEEASYTYDPPLFLKVSSVITMGISLVGTGVLYVLAAATGVSVSDYYAFQSAFTMLSGSFVALAAVAAGIARIRPTLDMARPIMEAVPEIEEDKQVVDRLSGGVEISHVTFRYREDMPNVLDDLSLKILPGQYVAIVGRTGCGKSTLVRILLGFEQAQKGTVYYDGRDIRRIDLKSLRSKIGTVLQNGRLFSGDIFSNIVISAPDLTMEDAWRAAEMAGMADDIHAMPMGMNTILSEGQGGISGGQRQRIMIARAIAPRPKMLLFDEATSALDNITQKTVSDALDSLKCTRIVIAHRLSTIRHCDRIVVLDQGRIVEDGTYESLIAKGGFFADLVARQQIEDAEQTANEQ